MLGSVEMAMRRGFFCALCGKHYDFQSRFDRHMASLGHQMLERTYKVSQDKYFVVTEDTEDTSDRDVSLGDRLCEVSCTLQNNAMDVSCKLFVVVVTS